MDYHLARIENAARGGVTSSKLVTVRPTTRFSVFEPLAEATTTTTKSTKTAAAAAAPVVGSGAGTAVSGQDLAALEEEIAVQGKIVAEKKAKKEPCEEDVKKLLELKGRLPEGHPGRPVSKAEQKKREKEAAAASAPTQTAEDLKRIKEERRKANLANQKNAAEEETLLTPTYGFLPLLQSRAEDRKGKRYTHISELSGDFLATQQQQQQQPVRVRIRGYAYTIKGTKPVFMLIRQSLYSIQCIIEQDTTKHEDSGIFNFAAKKIPKESIVDVEGVLVPATVLSASQHDVEIRVEQVFVVNRAQNLPVEVIDCARAPGAVNKEGVRYVEVNPDLRLDFRNIDLRTPVSQSIMRISSGVCQLFREFLVANHFIEVQTPKLLGGSSEGGADVFTTDYFGQKACLAQSPQLHKQILAACSGFERVFEIGPVFRAENSNTVRHLCEFHGLDLEMTFNEHYHEILDFFSDLFIYIFNGLNEKFKKEIETVREQYPFEDLVYDRKKTPVVSFKQGIEWLREAGVTEGEQGSLDDLSTAIEKRLGAIVKQKLGVDFYFLDQYPLSVRPFYTMPSAEDPNLSNSYDFMLRTQEIMSGAQRIHDSNLLEERVKARGVNPDSVRFYIDSFKYGALPHGGGGIGLERLVMLFLGLPQIRMATFFTRDPSRLTP